MLSNVGNRILDAIDAFACKIGVIRAADWKVVRSGHLTKLYAGKLSRGQPQFLTHLGLTPFAPSSRNIAQDITVPLPIPNNSIDVYQATDVFEHIPYEQLQFVINEIYRVLKPGGLFRLSVPDYRNDVYLGRSCKNGEGKVMFDPHGGGQFVDGKVVNGGHLWFPTYETVKALFDGSNFAKQGTVDYLHFTASDGGFVMKPIDYRLGFIFRTPDHDERVKMPPRPLSIVVDAHKAD